MIIDLVDYATSINITFIKQLTGKGKMDADELERRNWLVDDSDSTDENFELAYSATQTPIAPSTRATRSSVGTRLPVRSYIPHVIPLN